MMKFQISFNSFFFFGLTPSILIFIKYFFRLSWLFFVGCQTPSTELFFYMGTRRRRAVQTGRPHCHRVRVCISFVSLSFSCIYSFFFFYYSSPSILPLLFFFFVYKNILHYTSRALHVIKEEEEMGKKKCGGVAFQTSSRSSVECGRLAATAAHPEAASGTEQKFIILL